MTPFIKGIVASGISGHLTPAWSPQGAYDALASFTLSTSTTTITFTGIPTGYKYLELRFNGYSTRTASNDIDDYNIRFNSDNGSISPTYSHHSFFSDGAGTPNYTASTGASAINSPLCVGTNFSGSKQSGAGIITILDYASTNKYKTVTMLGSSDINGLVSGYSPGRAGIASGLWQSTTPVQSIDLYCSNGSWGQYSQFSLYGVR